MGQILQLELENFKSYKGDQVIGPFKGFTAVMGPNGAGKSNLMDAISFVVGLSAKDLRGEQLRDLIFNGDAMRDRKKRKAEVTLVYILDADEHPDLDAGSELRFTRRVSAGGHSSYRLQGREVTWAAYNQQLKDIGVMVKARNFLVFQGDVESIASKSPMQLCNFFEEICGSGDFAKDYESLKAQKLQAETDTIFTYKQKKGISLEKRQAKEQKEEADHFNMMLEDLADIKTEFYLWQLWHIQEDLSTQEANKTEAKEKIEDFGKLHDELDAAIRTERQKAAQVASKASAAERQLKIAKRKVSKQEPIAIKSKQAVSHLNRKVRDAEAAVKQTSKLLAKQTEDEEGIRADLESLSEAEATIAQQAMEDKEEREDQALSQEQLTELAGIKETVRTRTAELRARLEALKREVETESEREERMRRSRDQLTQHHRDLRAEREGLQARHDKMQGAITELETTVQETTARLEHGVKEREVGKVKRTALVSKLEEVKASLRNAKAQRAESRKETKMRDTIEAMTRHFEGVHGRLVDIVKPTQTRFDLALSVAMGRNMDAVVVDTESTARDCIKYLRDQRAGVLTFLPLDTIVAKPIKERLRSLGNQYRLAVDVLEYAPHVEKAVRYALGDVVVCDNLADARKLCFQDRERVKAVTIQGEIISKNGDMTGGTTDADRSHASRFEQKELNNRRKERENLEREITDLDRAIIHGLGGDSGGGGAGGASSAKSRRRSSMASRRASHGGGGGDPAEAMLQELEMAVTNARTRLNFAGMDLKTTLDKLTKTDAEIATVEAALASETPQYEAVHASLERQKGILADVEEEIKGVQEDLLMEFESKHGVQNALELEKTTSSRQQELDGKLAQLREQRSKMEAQLHYLQSRDLATKAAQAEAKLVEAKSKLDSQKEQADADAAKLGELKKEVEEKEEEFKALKSEQDAADAVVMEKVEERDLHAKTKAEIVKRLTQLENQRLKLEAQRQEILREAEIEQVKLPTTSDKKASKSKKKKHKKVAGGRGKKGKPKRGKSGDINSINNSDEEEEEDEVEEEEEINESRRSSRRNKGKSRDAEVPEEEEEEEEEEDLGGLDFSLLDDEQREVAASERTGMKKDYQERIHNLSAEIEKAQPNMRAGERLEDVSNQLKTTDDKLASARQVARDAELAFEEVKQQRFDAFQSMFVHVEGVIDKVYKELTKSAKHPLGGNAYLTLDNTEEPYMGGIKYNAMPPNKRFRDMEQLSGGEKTVAALALLFAIHSAHPSPFFVMDEVDAALDNVNVFKVSNYIVNNADKFQSIVISLKDTFYDKADALVGIYRERDLHCSKSLTLDMSTYIA